MTHAALSCAHAAPAQSATVVSVNEHCRPSLRCILYRQSHHSNVSHECDITNGYETRQYTYNRLHMYMCAPVQKRSGVFREDLGRPAKLTKTHALEHGALSILPPLLRV